MTDIILAGKAESHYQFVDQIWQQANSRENFSQWFERLVRIGFDGLAISPR
jgi:hypothetical protein